MHLLPRLMRQKMLKAHASSSKALSIKMALLFMVVLILALASAVGGSQAVVADRDPALRRLIPLGVEGFMAEPIHHRLYIIASEENPYNGRDREVEQGTQRFVAAGDRMGLQYFPTRLNFRITANAMNSDLMEIEVDNLKIKGDANQFLLNLGFRLAIFHGLEVQRVQPESVSLIGVPADVPYGERIWRVSFVLRKKVPTEDRIMLEVLTPERERICKFAVEF